MGNTFLANKIFYIQRYYCIHDEVYFWRFWLFGCYFAFKKKNRMDLKLTIILKDSEWGFSDLLDGRDLNHKTTQEIKDLIKEDYHSVMQNYIKIDKV